MPTSVVTRIRTRLDKLAVDPHAHFPNVVKLRSRPGFRMRIGDWRLIYEIRDDELIVLVLKIGARGDIYR